MSSTPHISPTRARIAHEPYSSRGLLAYAAAVPVFIALLAAPMLMLSLVLGALTAVLLNRALGVI